VDTILHPAAIQLKMGSPDAYLLAASLSVLGGCATRSAYSDLAAEQDRCAGYWRSTGDPDRANEMGRRAYESRQASASVGSWEDFFGTIFIDLLSGGARPKQVETPRHPSDGKGCQ
jgi:hypothetical protein